MISGSPVTFCQVSHQERTACSLVALTGLGGGSGPALDVRMPSVVWCAISDRTAEDGRNSPMDARVWLHACRERGFAVDVGGASVIDGGTDVRVMVGEPHE